MQLIGITALMIACKSEEILFPDIEDYVYICDNAYKSGTMSLKGCMLFLRIHKILE